MAHSIALDGDLELDDDYRLVEKENSNRAGRKWSGAQLDRHLIRRNEMNFFYHPLGLPLLLSPAVFIQQALMPSSAPDIALICITLLITGLGAFSGWQLLKKYAGNKKDSLLVVFALYFATPLWFYSRTVFTEPYLWAFSVIAVWLITKRRPVTAGVLLGLNFWVKEPSLLTTVPIVVAMSIRSPLCESLRLIFPIAIFGLLYLWKNFLLFGDPFMTFQPYQLGKPLEGVFGSLFDDTHGLLVFAPVLIIPILGWWKHSGTTVLSVCSFIIVVCNFLLAALWRDWGGGSCYGPRLLVPMIPFVAIPFLETMTVMKKSRWFGNTFALLTSLGFAIQLKAGLRPFKAFWGIPIHELMWAEPLKNILILMIAALLFRALQLLTCAHKA